MKRSRPASVDDYIASFPPEHRKRLKQLRALVRRVAPDAVESISYNMPAYKLEGRPLVYFAGHLAHIGFYALPTGHEKFRDELAGYRQGRGSVQFPIDRPLPLDLIERMVKFRVEENRALAAVRRKRSAKTMRQPVAPKATATNRRRSRA